MKHISDKDNNPSNCSSRTSRSKSDEGSNTPISKIEDFQSSMSAFSTRIESKNINNSRNYSNSNSIDKKKINKEKKKVKFNPLISVVNIESFKKQNFEGNFSIEDNCQNEILKEENKKKCFLCSIF